MKNHGFLLLFLFSLGSLYAQQPGNCTVVKEQDRGVSPQARVWTGSLASRKSSARAFQSAGHSGIDGVSRLAIGRNGSYFYVRDLFEGAIGKVYYRASAQAEEQLIFEPDAYATNKDQIYTVQGLYPDQESRRVAIAISAGESKICDLVIADLESRVVDNYLSDVSSGSVSWLPDGEHLLYHRWSASEADDPEFGTRTKSFLHRVGTSDKDDLEYFSAKVNSGLGIKDSEIPLVFYNRQLNAVIGVVETSGHLLKIYRQTGDLYEPALWEAMARETDNVVDFYVGDRFVYYKTAQEAQNFRLMAAQYRWPDISNAEEVVSPFDEEVIADFKGNRDGLYFTTIGEQGEVKLWFKSVRSKKFEHVPLPAKAKRIDIEVIDPHSRELWIHVWQDDLWEIRYRFDPDTQSFNRHTLPDLSGTEPIN